MQTSSLILLSFFIVNLAYSSVLTFPPVADWELREKIMGADYALIGENGKNSVIIKRIPQEVESKDVENHLKKIVMDKESAPAPWKNIKVVSTEKLDWMSGSTGRLMKVEHLKNNLPYTSLVGLQPDGKEYFLIYFSEETLKFSASEKEVLHALKSIKAH